MHTRRLILLTQFDIQHINMYIYIYRISIATGICMYTYIYIHTYGGRSLTLHGSDVTKTSSIQPSSQSGKPYSNYCTLHGKNSFGGSHNGVFTVSCTDECILNLGNLYMPRCATQSLSLRKSPTNYALRSSHVLAISVQPFCDSLLLLVITWFWYCCHVTGEPSGVRPCNSFPVSEPCNRKILQHKSYKPFSCTLDKMCNFQNWGGPNTDPPRR